MLFLVDENLPRGISEYLVSLNHDVLDMAASPYKGATDKVLWKKAAEDGRIVVTRDLDFPMLGSKPFPPCLILLRVPHIFTARQITELFKQSFHKIETEQFNGTVIVMSPGRMRISPLPR